jgi:hypothetical protein
MKIRAVTSLREFDELAGIWREVTEASGQHSLLLSHDWFACCWRTAGRNRPRELWIVEDSAGPLALIPLVHARTRYRGLPARVVQLMHPPGWPISDFPVAGDMDDVVKVFLDRLGVRDQWDVFVLPGMPTHSTFWKTLEPMLRDGFPSRTADRMHLPQVTLSRRDPSFHAVVEGLERAVAPGRAMAGHEVTIEVHPDPDPRGPLLDELMGVLRGGGATSSAGLPGPTSDEVRRFFRELAARPGTKGCLDVWVLRLDGRVVEAEYQISSGGSVHALRRDTDQSPPELRLDDALTLAILTKLARQEAMHTYHRVPTRPGETAVPASARVDVNFVEIFAAGSYGGFVHRLETRVMSLARRLGRQSSEPCA